MDMLLWNALLVDTINFVVSKSHMEIITYALLHVIML